MSLLDTLIGIFSSEEEQEAFQADPEGYLAQNGLGDITSQDITAEMPRVVESLQGNSGGGAQGGAASFDSSGNLSGAATGSAFYCPEGDAAFDRWETPDFRGALAQYPAHAPYNFSSYRNRPTAPYPTWYQLNGNITATVTALVEARKHSFPETKNRWKGTVCIA